MDAASFAWDAASIEHVGQHHFKPEEVEEVFENPHKVRRGRQGRYLALGQTLDGRLACVVFERHPGRRIRVVTARDMNAKERRLYRRK